MRTKAFQIFCLILATLFVALFILFIPDSLAVTTIAGVFTGVLGIFLGTDIMTMILKTKSMQHGDFKEINMHRYIIALFIFFALFVESFIITKFFGRDMNSLYLCFGVGILVVIGGLISGIEGNKAVTSDRPEK